MAEKDTKHLELLRNLEERLLNGEKLNIRANATIRDNATVYEYYILRYDAPQLSIGVNKVVCFGQFDRYYIVPDLGPDRQFTEEQAQTLYQIMDANYNFHLRAERLKKRLPVIR